MIDLALATLLFTARVNEIRLAHGMDAINFKPAGNEMVSYAEQCDPVRRKGAWVLMSAGSSSCGPNTPASRADAVYWLDYQYDDMRSPLFEKKGKEVSALLKQCPDGRFFIVVE